MVIITVCVLVAVDSKHNSSWEADCFNRNEQDIPAVKIQCSPHLLTVTVGKSVAGHQEDKNNVHCI